MFEIIYTILRFGALAGVIIANFGISLYVVSSLFTKSHVPEVSSNILHAGAAMIAFSIVVFTYLWWFHV